MTRLSRLRPVHVGLLIPWIVAVIAARSPLRDNSFLWHVAAGRGQIDSGSVFTADPFSFTFMGEPWRTQSWLVELGYGWLDERVGLAFVPYLVGGVAGAMFASIALVGFAKGATRLGVALVGGAGAWLGSAFLSPRPVLFGFLFLALVVLIEESNRVRWALPLILWVWAAVHASFVLGIVYVVAAGFGAHRKPRVLFIETAVMATPALLTAHGLGVVGLLFDFVQAGPALEYLTEWRPPDLLSLALLPATIAVLALVALGAKGMLGMNRLWLIVPGILLMFSATRSILPAFLFVFATIAEGLARWSREAEWRFGGTRQPSSLTWILALVVITGPFALPLDSSLDEARFPVQAVHRLDGGRVFSDDVSAGYLIYSSWPGQRVFVDDRAELYGDEFFADLVAVRRGTPQWSETFETWDIEQALVRTDEGLLDAVEGAGWVETYRDDTFVILEPPN